MLPFGFAAPVVAGAMRDASGSYVGALQLFVSTYVVAAGLLLLVRGSDPRAAVTD